MIPYGRQHITQADIDAVTEVLQSDFLTQGPAVPAFEQRLSELTTAEYAIAVNSATSALHIACLALGIGPGSRVWTSTISFVASANCARYCGADVDFVDVEPDSGNMAVDKLRQKLELARSNDTLPQVVIPVHLAGASCDMQQIHYLANEFGFSIIEDASHAVGAGYQDEPVGNCRYSDITVFSFHPVKIITTAEGGMATTNDNELATKLGLFRSHGITRDPALMTQEMDGPWYYQQVALGYNYRMTDIQAALGVSQMTRLNQYVAKRHEIAARYNELLRDLPVTLPWQHPDSYSAYHLYVIRLQLDKMQATHLQVFETLRANNIMVNLHYIPVHRQPYYQQMGFKQGGYPDAEQYYREAISIPMHVNLTEEELQFVATSLREAVGL